MTDDQRLLQRLRDYLDDTVAYMEDYESEGGISIWAVEEGDEWIRQTKVLVKEIALQVPPPDFADITESGLARALHRASVAVASTAVVIRSPPSRAV